IRVTGRPRAEIDVDVELALRVLAPRARPGAEADQQPDEEHPDQDRQRCGERGRKARGERAPRLGDDNAELHSAYPPRRSSRARRPSSRAITRRRILSTISRSCVTIRTVVPERLIR